MNWQRRPTATICHACRHLQGCNSALANIILRAAGQRARQEMSRDGSCWIASLPAKYDEKKTYNNNVNHTADRSRVSFRGRPCKNLSHNLVWSPCAKFGCCCSLCVCARTGGPKNLVDAGVPLPWDGAAAAPLKTRYFSIMCYYA